MSEPLYPIPKSEIQRPVKNWSPLAQSLLGPLANMLAFSEISYRRRYPNNVVLFNCRVFNAAGEIIWTGDLDLTVKQQDLQQLADQTGPIVITPDLPHFERGLPKDLPFDDHARAKQLSYWQHLYLFVPEDPEVGRDQIAIRARAIEVAQAQRRRWRHK